MAGEFLSEADLMAKWGINKAALAKLVELKRLRPVQREGKTVFAGGEVAALEASKGGQGYIGYEEVLQELQLNKSELNELVKTGKMTEFRFGGQSAFLLDEVKSLSTEKRPTGLEKKPTDLPAGFEKLPTVIEEAEPLEVEEPKTELDLGKAETDAEGEEAALFEFGEEPETEVKAEEVKATAGQKPVKEETPEAEMITDVLEIGEETSEEDLLGDIIEDVGGEAAATEEKTVPPAGEETAGQETSDEVTAEITQMEEETLAGSELEGVLAGEEEAKAEGEEEDFEVPLASPMGAAVEAPIPVWIVILLALTLIINVLGALYLSDNAVNAQYSTPLAKMLNPFKGG